MFKRAILLVAAIFALQLTVPPAAPAQTKHPRSSHKTYAPSPKKQKTVTVKSYKRKDGKTVQSYKRSAPRRKR